MGRALLAVFVAAGLLAACAGFEGISSIGVYSQIPAPGSLALLGLAALCLTRRRRA